VVRLYVNGQLVIDNFSAPYAPSIPVSGKIYLQACVAYDVRLEFRTLPFAWVSFGGSSGIQFSWASLQPPPELAGYNAVVLALGTNQQYEAEGHDRASFELPEFQDELILNTVQLNPRVTVVLHGSGSFDVQNWIGQVPALLQAWFPGQYGGQALADILFGDVNPSGKLPISWEKRLQDNPAYASLPAPDAPNTISPSNPVYTTIPYREGIFVGYRGLEKNGVQPQYPFGYGLSYTTFKYSNLEVSPQFRLFGTQPVQVSFTITNTGRQTGAEIAQVYVGEQRPLVPRPIKELKAFRKVSLQPGQSQRVTVTLEGRAFAYFSTRVHAWVVDPGLYAVLVGASSQDIRAASTVVNFLPSLLSVRGSQPSPATTAP
jgi:beta-glucosidase